MSFHDGTTPEGCVEMLKDDILNVLLVEHKVGENFNIYNHKYGEITVIATRTVGNLVLQHGFYPVAYIHPSTSIAALNVTYNGSPRSQLSLIQNLIKNHFKIIEFADERTLIEFVDANQNTYWQYKTQPVSKP